MNYKLIIVLLLAAIALTGAPMASARPSYLDSFNQHYHTGGTKLDSCTVCHNGEALNPYGRAYLEHGKNFTSIENLDSDGDGFTNIVEIKSLTFPGDPNDHPQTTSVTPSETAANATKPSANVTEQPVTGVPVNNTTEVKSTAEVPVSNATPEKSPAEAPGTTTEKERIPGFEAVLVVAGLSGIACLMGRNIRK